MKKIVFLRRQYTPYGGAEKHFQRLVDEIRRRDLYEVELRHVTQPSWLPSWLKLPLYDLQVCRKREEGAVYFSNDRLSCLDVHRAGGGTHKTFLKTKGFTLNPLHPIYLWLEKRTLQNAKQIIAISNMVKRDIVRDYDIPDEKITVIHNGIHAEKVDEAEMVRRKTAIFEEFGIKEGTPLLLFVGSGFERKGVLEFLEILSRLESPCFALIVGKEKRMGKYLKAARDLGVAQRVIFTGPRKDVEKFYCASDIFIFPTHYEPFGSVILEAMNYGNAVITTKQCGGGEVLEQEPLMRHPRDFSVTAYIDGLMRDRETLDRVQKRNMELAKEYTIERNVNRTIQVIEKVAE